MKKVRRDKNQALNQNDLLMIGRIILGWSLIYKLITRMTPEQYGAKAFLRGTNSKRRLSTIRLMFDTIRERSDPLTTPKEFNERLARDMLYESVNDLRDMTVKSEERVEITRYLDSPDMNFVLDTLEDGDIFDNVRGNWNCVKGQVDRIPRLTPMQIELGEDHQRIKSHKL
jgi:hypothetical protein